MSYKYTRDNDRKIFTTNGSKHADHFVSLVREIDWGWTYEGENTFLRGTYNENTDNIVFDFVQLQCTARLPPVPYFIFGGYVYEILNKKYGGLQKFLDPTGDVDVRINTPIVKLSKKDEDNEVYEFWYEDEKHSKLNDIMDKYTSYLFSSVLDKVTQMKIENTVDFDIKDDDDADVVADFVKVGNVYVAKVCNPFSVKIQVVCKFSNMDKPDHLFEMVWAIKKDTIGEDLENLKYYRESNPKIDDVFVQDLKSLLIDNVGSANDRISLYGTVKQHKWFNHIQRLKYLNYIFKQFIEVYTDKFELDLIGTFLCYMFLFLLKTEGIHLFSLGDRVAKTDVIFNQLTSNFLEYVIQRQAYINQKSKLIYKGQRVTFSEEQLNKYLKNGKIDIIIADIKAKCKDRTVPLLLKPSIVPTKFKSAYSLRRRSLKMQDNSRLGLRTGSKRKTLRRTKSM
jgi:hypothetical protein